MEHTNILDEKAKVKAFLYADKCFRLLPYSIAFFIGILGILFVTYVLNLMLPSPLMTIVLGIPIIGIIIFSGKGTWYGWQSIRFNEKDLLRQCIGLIGHLMLLFIVGIAIYSLIPSYSDSAVERIEPITPVEVRESEIN